jgi:hypothetical protein
MKKQAFKRAGAYRANQMMASIISTPPLLHSAPKAGALLLRSRHSEGPFCEDSGLG